MLNQAQLQVRCHPKNTRPQHRRREPCSFFIGPRHDLDRSRKSDAIGVQCSQHLEADHDPVRAVVFAAGWL